MHALDYLKRLKQSERAVIAIAAGHAPAYLNRILSTRHEADYVSIPLAVEITKHSKGETDLIGSLRPGTVVDWSYLKAYLTTKGF